MSLRVNMAPEPGRVIQQCSDDTARYLQALRAMRGPGRSPRAFTLKHLLKNKGLSVHT